MKKLLPTMTAVVALPTDNISQKAWKFLVLGFLFLAVAVFSGFSQSQTAQTFTGTGTWTCPTGVTSISVECWGAGGAGGGASGSNAAGGGGAGGAYTIKTNITVIPGTVYNVVVGTGGIGDTGAGNSGGQSYFNTAATVMAVGGTGGAVATANNFSAAGGVAPVTGNVGTLNFYGGSGGTGTSGGAAGGGGGGSAGTASDGNDASGSTGAVAVAGGGAGVNGSVANGGGASNTNIGGGGAGGRRTNGSSKSGGDGGDGQVIIYTNALWYNEITGTATVAAAPTYYTIGQEVASNATATGIVRGAGLTSQSTTNTYRTSAFASGALVTGNNDYYEFTTLAPAAGYYINYSSFNFTGLLSASTGSFALRSSLDSYGSTIGSVASVTTTATGFSVALTGGSFQNVITPITFRLYGYNIASTTTFFSMNDFSFIGAVIPRPTITTFSACGSPGSTLVIAGTNFTGATAVTIGGVNAPTFTVDSNTQITVTIPAGAVDGVITVTNGTVATSVASFDVVVASVLSGCPSSFSVNTSANGTGDCLGAVTYTAPTYTANCGTGGAIPGMTYLGTFGGNYYYRSTGSYTWTNAKANATLSSGKLAVISSAGENAQLQTWLSASGLNYWIGLTDAATEGTFIWDAGSPLNYSNWNTGEPNNAGTGEDYTEFVSGVAAPGKWNDNDNIVLNPYILEIGMFQTAGTITTGMTAAPGVYPISYQAFLPSGPTATCTFNVTVVDNELPTITCAPVALNTSAGACTATATLTAPTGADNCGVASVVSNHPSTTYPLGTTTVIWTVTDIHGNTNTCSSIVTVTDNIAPTVTCPSNISQAEDPGLCSATITPAPPTYGDNCTVTTLTWAMTGATTATSPGTGVNTVPSTVFNAGVTTVTYIAKDAANNTSASCSFTITVTELVLPTIACPSDYAVNTGPGVCTATVTTTAPTTSDNCAVVKLTWTLTGATTGSSAATGINNLPATAFNKGITTVTYNVFDASGNTATCSFTVTVSDATNPTLSCPGNVSLNVDAGQCTRTYTPTVPTYADNCAVTLLTWTMTGATTASSPVTGVNTVPSTVFNTGVTTITYNAQDAAGNAAPTCSFQVTVTDNILPTVACPGNSPQTVTAGTCTKTLTPAVPTYADNCGVTALTWVMTGATTGASAPTGINTVPSTIFNLGTTIITYTSKDAAGNSSATCSFNVVVTDNIAPTISCQSPNLTANAAAGTCSASVTASDAVVADNCSVAKLTWVKTGATTGTSPATGIQQVGTATYNVGVTTVTYTVTDGSGVTANCSFTVTITDTQAPTITCPSAITNVNTTNACSRSVVVPSATVADNCSVAKLTWSMTGATTAASGASGINQVGTFTFNVGVTNVVYVVTDASGLTATCNFSVTITDTQLPTITCPVAISTTNTTGGCAKSIAVPNATTADNCGVAKLTWTMSGATVAASAPAGINNVGTYTFNVGTTNVVYNVFDAAGNTATCNFNVTVADDTDPVISCPANVNSPADAGVCTRTFIPTPPTISDDCGVQRQIWTMTGVTTGSSPTTNAIHQIPSTAFNLGVTTITYTIRDAAGNSVNCSFTVTVTDNQPAVLTSCPASPVAVNTSTDGGGNCLGTITYTVPTYTENCAGAPISGMVYLGSYGGNYYYRSINEFYSWNSARTEALSKGGKMVTINSAAENAQIASWISATGTSYWIGLSDAATEGTFVWDAGGPLNYTNWAGGEPNNASGGEDHVEMYVNGTWNDEEIDFLDFTGYIPYIMEVGMFQTAGTVTIGMTVAPGTYPISYQAFAPGGSSSVCSFNVVVSDNENPTVTCPATPTINLGAACTVALPNYTTTAVRSDNCTASGSIVVTQSPVAGTVLSGSGTTIVTLTATDAGGNQGTCTFNVIRADVTNPTITCPATVNATVNPGSCTATVTSLGTPVTTDNCGVATVTNNHPSTTYPIGNTTVIWTVTDINGRTNTCNQTVTVTDNINPTITCPATVNANVTAGLCTATVASLGTPVTADNCSVASVTTNHPSTTYPLGNTTVIWTVTDASGNTATCNQTVTVTDNINPTITCPANLNVNVDAGQCTATVASLGSPITADNCSVASVSNNHPSTTYPLGVTTVIWTVTDGSGQTATCSQTVTVTDNINPTITCPSDIAVNVDAGLCTATIAALGTPVTADNCSVASVANDHPSTTFPQGVTTVTWTVTDGSGNIATCSQTVTVTDNINPTITCPSTQTLSMNASCESPLGDYTSLALVNDNCTPSGSLIIVQSPVPGTTVSGVGTTSVTLTVTDASGNFSSCSFDVNRIDDTAPTITCPATQELALDEFGNAILLDYTSLAVVADNCTATGSLTLVQSPLAGTAVSGTGITQVTITVTDASGNSEECSFDVQALDPTTVQLVSVSGTAADGSGTLNIAVSITNPSPGVATTVDLVLTSGAASEVGNFVTQTITFPAGSSMDQNFVISITDNALCGDLSTLTFTLQNASGGAAASVGSPSVFTLSITDDDLLTPVLLTDNAEDGSISDWSMPVTGDWTASTDTPVTGAYSIRHTNTGGPGESWVSYDMDDQLMNGVNTIWRFNVDHYGYDVTATDNFKMYLVADRADLITGTNGYAVAVEPGTPGGPEYVTLYRMENGVAVSPVTTPVLAWNTSFGAVGFEVERDEDALWTLRIDTTGGFDNLLPIGSGTDNQFRDLSYFGMRFRYNSVTSGGLAIDDIEISQQACPAIWYSQSTGNTSDAVWAQAPVGSPQAVVPSPYHDFIVQDGHIVNVDEYFVANDLSIENNAVLNSNANDVVVRGDLANAGTFNSDAGRLVFKGNMNQAVTSTSNLTLNNVVIDNDGFTVTLPSAVETFIKETSVISVAEGTLQTSDKLTIKSSITGTASIGTIANGADLLGKVTMQRYVPYRNYYPYGSWVAIGNALQGNTLQDWNDDFITTGFPGSDYPAPYPFTNIQWYDETVPGPFDNGYQLVTNVTDPLLSEQGYFVYMQTPAQNVAVTGDIQKHTFNQLLSYTNTGSPVDDGWNLFVNQYPSEVDFRKMVQNGYGLSTYYLYDCEYGNYKPYNGLIQIGLAPRYISSGQSFLVQANAPGAFLRYQEDFKTNTGVSFERDLPETAYANFRITSDNNSADECLLYFMDGATSDFEWMYDALKMNSMEATATELALVSTDDRNLSIDARPMETIEASIPVYVEMPTVGTYTFEIVDVDNVPLGSCMYIEDLVNGNTMQLQSGGSWSITVTEPYEGNRFLIHVSPAVEVETADATCSGLADGQVQVAVPAGEWTITLMDALGAVLNSASDDITFEDLNAGIYQVTVGDAASMCQPSTVSMVIGEPAEITAALVSSVVDHCNTSSDASVSFEVLNALAEYSYSIINSDGVIVSSGTSEDSLHTVNDLAASVYTINIENACGTQTFVADVRDPHFVEAEILSGDLSVIIAEGTSEEVIVEQSSINADAYAWTLSNGYSSNEEVFTFAFDSEGEYVLTLNASNEFCSDTHTITVSVDEVVSISELGTSGAVTMIQGTDMMTFALHGSSSDNTTITIYDIAGKAIWSITTSTQDGKRITTGLANMASGVYVVKAITGQKEVLNRKFFK